MEEEGEHAPDIRDYARTIGRHRWLIALTVVFVVLAGVIATAMQATIYTATAQLVIQRSDTLDSGPQDAQDAARNVDTETGVLRSKVVQDAAEKRLGYHPDVTVASSETSDVVSVSANSGDAAHAASDANAYANAYVDLRRTQNIAELQQAVQQVNVQIAAINGALKKLRPTSPAFASDQEQATALLQQRNQLQVAASLSTVAGARLLSPATVPTSPTSPKPLRNVAIALVLGLLLGIALAFLREYLNDTVTTREDLERATEGLSILGEIPRISGWRDRENAHLVTADAPHSPAAESYRTLRTSIEFIALDRELRSIQVTSSQTDDGKTTTLANLALAFARAGTQVTIVCCDLRRPRVHEFFGLSNDVGFTSVLLGRSTVTDALQPVNGEPNLTVLAAGPPPPNPSELLSSSRAADTLASIEKTSEHSLVLVDSPPVLAVGDALIVSGLVDATLLVASEGSSSRRALQRTVQMLRQVNAPLLGTVLNNAEMANRDYGYGYAAKYDATSTDANGSPPPNTVPGSPPAGEKGAGAR
jgi:polysaccharide biosynthesis transport protein